MSHLEVLTAYS